ncbi:MAG: hypothetical protein QJR03_15015 [Sphaerobacter sp.]|nr:hypothetical protein [Sphaerobacter sp.]
MSHEDLLYRLYADLVRRARPEPPSENAVLNKFTAPTDTASVSDVFAAAAASPSSFVWGGGGYTPGWQWGAGQWRGAKAPIFSRASVAYLPDGTQVASGAPRFVAGQAGQALVTEEGTTNLLTANQASGGDALGNTSDFNSYYTSTLSYDSSTGFRGGSIKVVTDSGGTNPYSGVIASPNQAAPFAQGSIVSVSAWVKMPAGQTFYFGIRWGDGTNRWDGPTTGALTGTGNWQYVKVENQAAPTSGTPSGNPATHAGVQCYVPEPPAGSPVTFWIDQMQVEVKPYATSWIDGGATRAAETLSIPASVVTLPEGTVEVWTYCDNAHEVTTGARQLFFALDSTNSNNLQILWDTDGKYKAAVKSAGTRRDLVGPSTLATGWHLFALTWSATSCAFYIDGALQASGALPLPTALTQASLGCWPAASHQWDLPIDGVRISSRTRTASEIAAAASAYLNNGTPPPVDADTSYYLGFDGSMAWRSSA